MKLSLEQRIERQKTLIVGATARAYSNDWIVRMGARDELTKLTARLVRLEAQQRKFVKLVP